MGQIKKEKEITLNSNRRGITLVALVISVIVIIILSVVTFNLTVGGKWLDNKSISSKVYDGAIYI